MARKDVENDQRISDENDEADKVEVESKKTLTRKEEPTEKITVVTESYLINQKLDACLAGISLIVEKLKEFK